MFLIFSILLAIYMILYAIFSWAVLHHLFQYTLPGWRMHKLVIPSFFALSFVFFIFAVYFFLKIPWNELSSFL